MPRQTWPSQATIFEVGPRDGLQSEDRVLDLDTRFRLVAGLIDAGLPDIEIGSFVRPDRLPQVAHTGDLLQKIRAAYPADKLRTNLWAFIPNDVGLQQAVDAGIDGASFFIGVSDTFCHKNVNRARAEILETLPALLAEAKRHGLRSRVYVSTVVFCPYEGAIDPQETAQVVEALGQAGASEIVLSDTTGDANPRTMSKLLEAVLEKVPAEQLALHLHDTRGLALVNILEGMKFGVARFDSSVGGMGGCPYAPGASGNLATEDLLNMLLGMDVISGIDLGGVAKVGYFAEQILGKKLPARMLRTLEKAGR